VPSHLFVPDPEIFPQLEGLELEVDNEQIYVFDVDTDSATEDSKHPMVSILITDDFIGEEVKPEKKHHQAYTLMGEKKPGVVYKRKYRKAEDRIQPIAMQLPEEFCIVCNIIGDPL
jgi:rhodanese-related sulfurtransferase